MRPGAIEPRRWSGRRWFTTIMVLLAGQVIVIFLLSERSPPPIAPKVAPVLFSLSTAPAPAPTGTNWLEDPAQFALASAHGFSGPVWLRRPRFERPAREWSEPPHWLTQEVARLGAPGEAALAAPAARAAAIADKPAPAFGGGLDVADGGSPRSSLRLEGEIARRKLLGAWELPGWPHTELVQPSVVQVLVDAAGSVLSAALLGRSGLPAADQRALELARSAQFEPAAKPSAGLGLMWGRMIFRWQVAAPGATNPAPARAAPR